MASSARVASVARNGRWLNIVTHLDPAYGGLSAAVPALCKNVASFNRHRVSIGAFCVPQEAFVRDAKATVAISEWPAARRAWWQSRTLNASFSELVQQADGVHIHGLWEQSTWAAASAARRHKRPYIVSAHGMLDQWALGNRWVKKAIYSALVEKANVLGATCLHALTHAEAQDYVAYGARQPIAVIPNGVDVPGGQSPRLFLGQFPELRDKRLVLFLGRIHFKKGLDLLLEAWKTIAQDFPQTHLVLAGPDCEGTQQNLERMMRSAALESRITFTGMLHRDMKWSAFAAADCFVLPSYSEGLSVAVLEAMGSGLPVIVSTACHLPEIARRHAGWVIPTNASALHDALGQCLSDSCLARQQMGMRGKALVQECFSWLSVARRMDDLYASVLSGGSMTGSFEIVAPKRWQ